MGTPVAAVSPADRVGVVDRHPVPGHDLGLLQDEGGDVRQLQPYPGEPDHPGLSAGLGRSQFPVRFLEQRHRRIRHCPAHHLVGCPGGVRLRPIPVPWQAPAPASGVAPPARPQPGHHGASLPSGGGNRAAGQAHHVDLRVHGDAPPAGGVAPGRFHPADPPRHRGGRQCRWGNPLGPSQKCRASAGRPGHHHHRRPGLSGGLERVHPRPAS